MIQIHPIIQMGCEQSDIEPFLNAFADDNPQPQNNQRGPPNANPRSYPNSNSPQPYVPNNAYPSPQAQPPQQNIQAPNTYTLPSEQLSVSKKQLKVDAGGQKRPRPPRQYLWPLVDYQLDFLTHHLKYELTLTKLVNMKRIKQRQVVEHLWLQTYWGNYGGIKSLNIGFQAYQQSLISAWIQRTFLDIWEDAHNDFFVKHLQEKQVRRKVAEQYMFELYQIKEFVDAGMSALNFFLDRSQAELIHFVQASDDALFNLFKKLKDRYPQTGSKQNVKFPDVPSTKTDMNLLNNFQNLSFSDPAHMNYQTIYEDINFLLKTAIKQQDTFKDDMKQILGDDVLACPKVGQTNRDGATSFNAGAVRRVFVKWAENLLQKCPDLVYTKSFMNFVKARSDIVNNFFFKSTVQPTTHKIVIDCISLLLQVAKYNLKDGKRRSQFIFNIYDLLRCKIKRNTPEQIVDLLKKMQSTSVTKNGKKFEVIRVKNRFKTNNRDLLINFRYGDILIGEAQLCIDNSNVSKQTKLNYQFCHYIYELERSLFGPTLELMMQYQDFQRSDITVSFQAQDTVKARGSNELIQNAGPVQRKCLHGHDMITTVGNFFFPARQPGETEQQIIATEYPAVCNYCDRSSTVQVPFDYCYHCGCYLCTECRAQYKKVDTTKFWLSVQRQDLLSSVGNINQLQNLCTKNKSMIVLFWLDNSSPSTLYKDTIIYQQGKLMMQPGKYVPKIAQAKATNTQQFRDLCNKYGIKEFPTLILFNQQAQAIRTIIGFSWFETPNLYMSQKILIDGGSLDLDIYCNGCDGKMQAKQVQPGSTCLNCFNVNQPINLPQQLLAIGAYCSQNHYRCINCCYAAMDCPTTYKDSMGGSYMTSNFIAPALAKCPKGHQTVLSRAPPQQSWEFKCFKCNKTRYFDNENGVGECGQCKAYLCARCMGAKLPNFTELAQQSNLVRHFVQSSAEQACLCMCNRHFKKVYISRILSMDDIEIANTKPWICVICHKQGKRGQLHLSCNGCPMMTDKDTGKKNNLQICMLCATKSNMLVKEQREKVVEAFSIFSCPYDNAPLLQTSKIYNSQLVIKCSSDCKLTYFGNTERFYCKSCNRNYCYNCRQSLWKDRPAITCQQKCANGHELALTIIKGNLELCDGCIVIVKDETFKCKQCNYALCQKCVMTTPADYVGHAIEQARGNIQEVVYEEDAEQGNKYGVYQGRNQYQEDKEGGGVQGFLDFIGDLDF